MRIAWRIFWVFATGGASMVVASDTYDLFNGSPVLTEDRIKMLAVWACIGVLSQFARAVEKLFPSLKDV